MHRVQDKKFVSQGERETCALIASAALLIASAALLIASAALMEIQNGRPKRKGRCVYFKGLFGSNKFMTPQEWFDVCFFIVVC